MRLVSSRSQLGAKPFHQNVEGKSRPHNAESTRNLLQDPRNNLKPVRGQSILVYGISALGSRGVSHSLTHSLTHCPHIHQHRKTTPAGIF